MVEHLDDHVENSEHDVHLLSSMLMQTCLTPLMGFRLSQRTSTDGPETSLDVVGAHQTRAPHRGLRFETIWRFQRFQI